MGIRARSGMVLCDIGKRALHGSGRAGERAGESARVFGEQREALLRGGDSENKRQRESAAARQEGARWQEAAGEHCNPNEGEHLQS